jgi:hypothetical protein
MLSLRLRGGHAVEHQVFFADPRASDEAVPSVVAIEAAGLANNVNYSEAAIMASIARLDEVGVAHTDAGANWAFARAPAILRRDGVRFGFGAAQLGLLAENSIGWYARQEFMSRHKNGGLPAGPSGSRCFPECRLRGIFAHTPRRRPPAA